MTYSPETKNARPKVRYATDLLWVFGAELCPPVIRNYPPSWTAPSSAVQLGLLTKGHHSWACWLLTCFLGRDLKGSGDPHMNIYSPSSTSSMQYFPNCMWPQGLWVGLEDRWERMRGMPSSMLGVDFPVCLLSPTLLPITSYLSLCK